MAIFSQPFTRWLNILLIFTLLSNLWLPVAPVLASPIKDVPSPGISSNREASRIQSSDDNIPNLIKFGVTPTKARGRTDSYLSRAESSIPRTFPLPFNFEPGVQADKSTLTQPTFTTLPKTNPNQADTSVSSVPEPNVQTNPGFAKVPTLLPFFQSGLNATEVTA